MKSLLPIILFIIISGCEQKENATSTGEINETMFKILVTNAIDSNVTANNNLAKLVDYSRPRQNDYNSVNTGSIATNNTNYYYVVLENSNPLYNRFAVYNSTLTPLLIDKSLNGNIFIDNIKAGKKDFIRIDESYLSKDILILNRLSLYLIDTSGVSLSFRTHTRFSKPDIEYFQDIVEINDVNIKTRIRSSGRSSINNKEDNFVFDYAADKYSSTQNIFDEFIKKEIENFIYQPEKQQIVDTVTAN